MKLLGWEIISRRAAAERYDAALEREKDKNRAEGRARNLQTEVDSLRTDLENCDGERRQGYELLKYARVATAEAQARSELAERVVQSQAGSIETAMRSNEHLVKAMMEMRRVGFGLIADVLKEDAGPAKSVDKEDQDAVDENPEEHAKEFG